MKKQGYLLPLLLSSFTLLFVIFLLWELIEKNGVFKARPKKLDISEEELMSNQEAVDICPVDAIKIEKIKGRQSSIADDEEDGEDDDEETFLDKE